jgi:hypothetical protein
MWQFRVVRNHILAGWRGRQTFGVAMISINSIWAGYTLMVIMFSGCLDCKHGTSFGDKMQV